MELVRCSNLPGTHWDAILEIRNENREGFGDPSIIRPASHCKYMFNNFSNYLLCVEGDKVLGFIGHVKNDIRLSTRKEYQRRGIAELMLESFMEKHPKAIAKVKLDNEASLKLFEKYDFKKKYYILER
tara:strand:+ start:647 stop:1030 length:384 start_codon:yes stop_codon:yes gene_type:complete